MAGNVISSNPVAATEVARLSAVAYVVSSGPALVAVPDIIDLPESEALKALGDAGLAAGTRSEASDATIVAGNVISSDPVAATEVARLSAVAYVVSSGPALVAVPDIIDLPESEALEALADAGLVAGTRSEASDATIVAGNVMSSDPAAATEVAAPLEPSPTSSPGPRARGRARPRRPARGRGPHGPRRRRPGGRDPSEACSATIVAGQRPEPDPEPRTEVARGSGRRLRRLPGPRAVAVPDLVGRPSPRP